MKWYQFSRQKEKIGILYANGFKKKDICKMFLIPIIINVLIASIIAVISLTCVYFIIDDWLTVKPYTFIKYFTISWQTILMLLGFDVIILLFSYIPLARYFRKKPIEIIKSE